MAKRKQIATPDPAPMPHVGDKVKRPGSDSILESPKRTQTAR
jgi:hypothetical protein